MRGSQLSGFFVLSSVCAWKSVLSLEFSEDGVVTSKVQIWFFVSVVWHVVIFKVLCICMQGVKSCSFEKPSSAQQSPCCWLLKRLALLQLSFQRKTCLFVCFCCCLGSFFYACVCVNCLQLSSMCASWISQSPRALEKHQQ